MSTVAAGSQPCHLFYGVPANAHQLNIYEIWHSGFGGVHHWTYFLHRGPPESRMPNAPQPPQWVAKDLLSILFSIPVFFSAGSARSQNNCKRSLTWEFYTLVKWSETFWWLHPPKTLSICLTGDNRIFIPSNGKHTITYIYRYCPGHTTISIFWTSLLNKKNPPLHSDWLYLWDLW